MDSKNNFYNTFEDITISNNECFLCGKSLDDSNISKEHIIPKWMQNKFDF